MVQFLPPLRHDLRIKPAENDPLGRSTWVVHDPIRNRFFSLDWLNAELLQRWELRDPSRILAEVNAETTMDVDADDLQDLLSFLERHELLQLNSPQANDRLYTKIKATRPGLLPQLLKQYLYLRIPLINPEPILALLAPFFKLLSHSIFKYLSIFALLLGVFQLSRRWDQFIYSFSQMFNLSSLLQVALVVVTVKVLHEFGHAWAAYSRGCRVPRMGVVFLVLLPVAYTDVTDSWKLPSKERLSIALAGIRVELTIAAWATLIWGLLSPGGFRDGLFLILTVTWIGTLVINASPFMRFDGYFVLMDWIRLPNLHQRAAALGRWRLRRLLFADQTPAPEYLGKYQWRLVLFAYLTWMYRLVVLGGIAWLVYQLLPQPFGLLLAAVEIYWFIMMPVIRELRIWPSLILKSLSHLQVWLSFGLIVALCFLLIWPWKTSFDTSAVVSPRWKLPVELSENARLVEIVDTEQRVLKGDLLARFENPDLSHELLMLDAKIQETDWLLKQKGFIDEILLSGAQLSAQLAELQAQRESVLSRMEMLNILAPESGYYIPKQPLPTYGSWMQSQSLLGTLYSGEHTVKSYISAEQRYWIAMLSGVVWRSDWSERELVLEGGQISLQAAQYVEFPLLLKASGGDITAFRTDAGWVPDREYYLMEFELPEVKDVSPSEELGVIELRTRPHSPIQLIWNSMKQIFQQDFGVYIAKF